MLPGSQSLDLSTLSAAYASGDLRPSGMVEVVLDRIAEAGDDKVWIHRSLPADLRRRAAELEALDEGRRAALPLYGIPFAVKDNIDVAGIPTTAGCPDYAYRAADHAASVRRLLDVGAILVGKTNMDQFATGLVGLRSPYGAPRNPFDPAIIPGGSSSGSAVAVAAGLVSFALGTDTAGSGRVPAGFNNIVGLKPTKGLVSTSGVVPACRSLDCVSIFGLTVEDCTDVLKVLAGWDEADPYSRAAPPSSPGPAAGKRVGVPAAEQRCFFGDRAAEAAFRDAVERMASLGWQVDEIDFSPFRAAGDLLYRGPWVAERTAAVGDFIAAHPGSVLDLVRRIILGGTEYGAAQAFRAAYRLEELRKLVQAQWQRMDLLLVPTTGILYRLAEVEADPVATNANLGFYTDFANLLDLCAVAVPSGFRPDCLPFGVTLMAPAFSETLVATAAADFHRSTGITMGATGHGLASARAMSYGREGRARLLVVGGHLSGQPLNHQLTGLGASLVEACRTAPRYRLFALPGLPRRPGMIRVAEDGMSVEGEIWEMTPEAYGRFVAAIPGPLGIGQVELADGRCVSGFLCETIAVAGAEDISRFGGWRSFMAAVG
jgi:allophanate hydrolase